MMKNNNNNNILLTNDPDLQRLYDSLMNSFIRLGHLLRHSSNITNQGVGIQNHFGDIQLDSDVQGEDIINEELKNSGVVSYSINEETPKPLKLGEGSFIVTFDPLDGSSVIGQNWSVGTIVGIWPHDDNILINKSGRDMIAACCCIYGPRLTMIVTNNITNTVEELAYLEFGKENKWVVTKNNISITKKGNLYSPGNSRAASDNKVYKKLIDYYIENQYTLRYSGSMASDIYQLFIRETGVFCCLVSEKSPAKLRFLYESAPLAFLVEKAGGMSTDGNKSILDTIITGYYQKGPICLGTLDEIKKIEQLLKANS